MTQPNIEENVNLEVKPTPKDSDVLTDLEKRELLYVHSANEISDKILAYCGAFAGFEGFIINAYVGSTTPIPTASSIAYFFLFWSLFSNILAASLALLISGMIKNGVGLGEYWWIRHVMRVITFSTLGATALYAMAFQLYVCDSVVSTGYKIAIWVISSFLASIVIMVFYIVFNKSKVVSDEKSEKVLRFYNGNA